MMGWRIDMGDRHHAMMAWRQKTLRILEIFVPAVDIWEDNMLFLANDILFLSSFLVPKMLLKTTQKGLFWSPNGS